MYIIYVQMFELQKNDSPEATDELYALSSGASFIIKSYPACVVNGVKFLTYDRDGRRKTQSSGIFF